MSDIGLVIYGIAGVFLSIFSSIAGGGGGLVATPLMIFLGLSPQEAIASGKPVGLSLAASNVRVVNKHKFHSWSTLIPIMVMAAVIGLIAPQFITRIEGDIYQKLIGLLILSMIPVVHYKKVGLEKKIMSKKHKRLGFVLVGVAFMLQSLFSSGLGMLANLAMAGFLGMSALEANISKRYVQILMNSILILGLIGSGLIIWQVSLVGAVANFTGGTIGAHLSVKKGNGFVMNALKVVMFLSGAALLVV